MLSRTKPANAPPAVAASKDQKKKKKLPKFEELLSARDYTGAMTVLEVRYPTLNRLESNEHLRLLIYNSLEFGTEHFILK